MALKFYWKPKRLLRDLLVLALLAGLILFVAAYLGTRALHDISEKYIHNATERAAGDYQAMKSEAELSLGMVRDWGVSGLVDLADPVKTKELLVPLFKNDPWLSGISVADMQGRHLFLLSDGTVPYEAKETPYNPSERLWFTAAAHAEESQWTEVYRFITLEELGITASVAWPDKNGKRQTVAAFDILLEDLLDAINQLAPTASGRAITFLPDGRLYVPDTESENAAFKSVELIKDGLAKRGLEIWATGARREVAKMQFEGKAWWCGFAPLAASKNQMWVGVFVPEADILGGTAPRRRLLFGIGAAAVLAMMALYVFFVWRNGSRELQLGDEVEAEQIRAIIERGENRYVEFKSTMRMNLHSKKPGKEIELAWLKGVCAFLNTDGGMLLLGVTDAGEITGLEQDVFENEDKCRLHFKNLIANHIGAETSEYVRFIMVPMEGKTVGVVRCSQAADPVFLRDGNKEAFYIRNGPASDELPVSKALKYIKHRK
ncbi:RNA-binding domain-containing protein [Pontiella sulfatireligans]|uniref:Schlafen AlbA-2 domain-containing protein n=1 Tax=Pontiella sulfatireligans TaxID=2750658 RepID=A0A6C2UR17_9BACT|nr:RNA-binding domain-containing protein [Pontiella sulfatireligans]VGO21416.1 hypothetical protein SCARR_03489 [Pontiella sulfatireligans]